jgi:hypothetical protein
MLKIILFIYWFLTLLILVDTNKNPTIACADCGIEIPRGDFEYHLLRKNKKVCSGCYTFIQKGNGG